MHEMSLAEGVRGIVEETVAAQGLRAVKAIVLEIGELSSVEPDALAFCLEAVLRDTVAEGARVEIERIAGAGWCLECDRTVPLAQRYDACPNCGGYRVQPTAGTEMRVRELEAD
ncbi:MAG: hydrogenase maturation nickel metallochaperone HypA [Rhodocyclaceae bacterium]|jgi:hydrogenase nickel incorporation protein HypA/HybF|nr:hydrogenase maturation nickel metallochaperone HypA [Rhodocyclaceae bacterium]